MDQESREVCVCFHVPLGKLLKHYRLRRPRLASQFAGCHGAGTGCGWCVPFLERLFEQLESGEPPSIAMSMAEYKCRREEYFRQKHPALPPPPDADGPINMNLDELLERVDDGLKLD